MWQPFRIPIKKIYGLRKGDWMFINSKSGMHSKVPAWYEEEQGYTKEETEGLLFNLKKDPGQHENLYASYPEKVAEMNALLERYLAGEGCAPHAE